MCREKKKELDLPAVMIVMMHQPKVQRITLKRAIKGLLQQKITPLEIKIQTEKQNAEQV